MICWNPYHFANRSVVQFFVIEQQKWWRIHSWLRVKTCCLDWWWRFLKTRGTIILIAYLINNHKCLSKKKKNKEKIIYLIIIWFFLHNWALCLFVSKQLYLFDGVLLFTLPSRIYGEIIMCILHKNRSFNEGYYMTLVEFLIQIFRHVTKLL